MHSPDVLGALTSLIDRQAGRCDHPGCHAVATHHEEALAYRHCDDHPYLCEGARRDRARVRKWKRANRLVMRQRRMAGRGRGLP